MKKIIIFAAAAAMLSFAACSNAAKSDDAKDKENTEAPATSDKDKEVNKDEKDGAEAKSTDAVAANEKGVINLKDDSKFRPGANVNKVTVLDFNAKWCVPCKKLTPAFHQVAEEMTDVEFYNVDIDSLPNTATAFGVESIPMVVIISPDGTVNTFNGLTPFMNGAPADADDLTPVIAENLKALVLAQKK